MCGKYFRISSDVLHIVGETSISSTFSNPEVGYVKGMENYSRHMAGRAPGARPSTLIDFVAHAGFGSRSGPRSGLGERQPWLLIVDESHVAVPQTASMFNADRARKLSLVTDGRCFAESTCS